MVDISALADKMTRERSLSLLRIFISSTAVDLREYRDKVRDAVLRLEDLPIAMETFSAQSGVPAKAAVHFRR